MRTISSLCAALALIVSAHGQSAEEEEKYGFIRLVNAVAPGEGYLRLLLNDAEVYPDGYRLGDATGGIGVATGRCEVVVMKEGVETGKTRVDVGAGKTTTVIPFAEKVPATDDEPAHWQIRVLRLKQEEREEGRNATFISVSSHPEVLVEIGDPDGSFTKVPVKRFSTARTPINWPKGYVPLRIKTGELQSIPVVDEGNYVVVLYDDVDGNVSSLSFRDYRHLTAD